MRFGDPSDYDLWVIGLLWPSLPVMLDMMRLQGLDLSGRFFDGDKGYDSDENCEMLFEMGFIPNIKQRKDAVNRGKPSRSKAARLFDQDETERGV